VNLLYVTYFLNGILMIAMPIGLTIYLTRIFKHKWHLVWIGAATFIISQVLHIPFNSLVSPEFNKFSFISLPLVVQNVIISIFFGLSAGFFEELSRYAMYRWWAKDARMWGSGLLAGVGHGGIEAIILGFLVLYGYIQMIIVRGMDISKLVAPDKIELISTQIQAFWSAPWYLTILGALERLFTIPLHLACSLLVLQVFTRNKIWWVGLAVLFHALVDGMVVFVSQIGFSMLATEGIIGIFALVSTAIIFALRQPESHNEPDVANPINNDFILGTIGETEENLENSRFQ
jgi:uncharacterized membrane protein YhfC